MRRQAQTEARRGGRIVLQFVIPSVSSRLHLGRPRPQLDLGDLGLGLIGAEGVSPTCSRRSRGLRRESARAGRRLRSYAGISDQGRRRDARCKLRPHRFRCEAQPLRASASDRHRPRHSECYSVDIVLISIGRVPPSYATVSSDVRWCSAAGVSSPRLSINRPQGLARCRQERDCSRPKSGHLAARACVPESGRQNLHGRRHCASRCKIASPLKNPSNSIHSGEAPYLAHRHE